MENTQKYGLGLAFFSLLLLVVILGVYFVNDISSGNTQTVITKAAEISPNLSIISPTPGEEIKGKGFFEAKFQTTKNISSLKGVLKVGEGKTLPLDLKPLDDKNVIVSGEFDTKDYIKGRYYIKIYIYDTSEGKVVSVADALFPIFIGPQ